MRHIYDIDLNGLNVIDDREELFHGFFIHGHPSMMIPGFGAQGEMVEFSPKLSGLVDYKIRTAVGLKTIMNSPMMEKSLLTMFSTV